MSNRDHRPTSQPLEESQGRNWNCSTESAAQEKGRDLPDFQVTGISTCPHTKVMDLKGNKKVWGATQVLDIFDQDHQAPSLTDTIFRSA